MRELKLVKNRVYTQRDMAKYNAKFSPVLRQIVKQAAKPSFYKLLTINMLNENTSSTPPKIGLKRSKRPPFIGLSAAFCLLVCRSEQCKRRQTATLFTASYSLNNIKTHRKRSLSTGKNTILGSEIESIYALIHV